MSSTPTNDSEADVRAWIQEVISSAPDAAEVASDPLIVALTDDATPLKDTLSDGAVLCRVMNALQPERIVKILSPESTPFVFMRAYENLTAFKSAAEQYGIATADIFQWTELAKGENFERVMHTLTLLRAKHAAKQAFVLDTTLSGDSMEGADLDVDDAVLNGLKPGSREAYMRTLANIKKLERENQQKFGMAPGSPVTSSSSSSSSSYGLTSASKLSATAKPFSFTPTKSTSTLNANASPFVRRAMNAIGIMKKQSSGSGSGSSSEIHSKLEEMERQIAALQQQTPARVAQRVGVLIREYEEQEQDTRMSDIMNAERRRQSMSSSSASGGTVVNAETQHKIAALHADFAKLKKEVVGWLQQEQASLAANATKMVEALQATHMTQAGFEKRLAKEQKQRRKWLNKCIEMQGNIRVFCRVRPLNRTEKGNNEEAVVTVLDEECLAVADEKNKNKAKTYQFNRVFGPDSTQEQVFAEVSPLVHSAIDGYNVCIFAYGQTGSGKTYTMEGPTHDRGVNFRALGELFDTMRERRAAFKFNVTVSVVEIYNEQARDLLRDNSPPLDVRQGKNGPYIPDLTSESVSSVAEVQSLMKDKAYANRHVGVTSMNEHSSRSHCLLFVNVNGENTKTGSTTTGKLIMVDLAGSERVKKSEAKGERLKEAQFINRSLSALGDVISSLKKDTAHIPYRNSKLTFLLQECLGGNSKCLMFCQVGPAASNAQESGCSLKFASRVGNVTLGAAGKNTQSGETLRLKQQVEKMKETMKSKQEALDALKKKMTLEHDSQNDVKDNVRQLQRELKGKDREIKLAQAESTKLTDVISKKDSKLEQLSSDVKAAHQQRDESDVKLKQQMCKLETADVKINQLTVALREAEAKMSEMKAAAAQQQSHPHRSSSSSSSSSATPRSATRSSARSKTSTITPAVADNNENSNNENVSANNINSSPPSTATNSSSITKNKRKSPSQDDDDSAESENNDDANATGSTRRSARKSPRLATSTKSPTFKRAPAASLAATLTAAYRATTAANATPSIRSALSSSLRVTRSTPARSPSASASKYAARRVASSAAAKRDGESSASSEQSDVDADADTADENDGETPIKSGRKRVRFGGVSKRMIGGTPGSSNDNDGSARRVKRTGSRLGVPRRAVRTSSSKSGGWKF